MTLRMTLRLIGVIAMAGVAVAVGLVVSDGGGAAAMAAGPGGKVSRKAPKEILFAHDAKAGSLVRVAGTRRLYDLKLTGVHPSALYFADRPDRLVGSVPLSRMLAGFFAEPGKTVPPNAAINAIDPPTDDQLLMGVELLSAKYSVKTATLTYRVRTLP